MRFEDVDITEAREGDAFLSVGGCDDVDSRSRAVMEEFRTLDCREMAMVDGDGEWWVVVVVVMLVVEEEVLAVFVA